MLSAIPSFLIQDAQVTRVPYTTLVPTKPSEHTVLCFICEYYEKYFKNINTNSEELIAMPFDSSRTGKLHFIPLTDFFLIYFYLCCLHVLLNLIACKNQSDSILVVWELRNEDAATERECSIHANPQLHSPKISLASHSTTFLRHFQLKRNLQPHDKVHFFSGPLEMLGMFKKYFLQSPIYLNQPCGITC